MGLTDASPVPSPQSPLLSDLAELQRVLDSEIPMCGQMGLRVVVADADWLTDGLRVSMPLAKNHNHQRTAFAGSLNALCTIAGWSATYLNVRAIGGSGVIVIRRSSIKYHRPIATPTITAHCLPPSDEARDYFREMLAEKGQAKLDLHVKITEEDSAEGGPTEDRPAVAFQGSYVVLPTDEGRIKGEG